MEATFPETLNMEQPQAQTFHVTAAEAGKTLAGALRAWQPGQSWTQVKQVVERRRVLVNGNLCVDDARRLKVGEVVKLLARPKAKPPEPEQVRIRYLDDEVVVVEKPAEVTTVRHPEERDWPERRKQKQPTLDELLPKVVARELRLHGRAAPGERRLPRIRAVHRLDRDTSGLMVFARTEAAERHLGRQFRDHSIHRVYWAVVLGQWTQDRTLESDLVRDRGDGRRGSKPLPDLAVGKHAVTHVRPIEVLKDYTLVECRLETGRTHQIRIHLAEAGHMLCGEKVYNKTLDGKTIPDPSGAPRIALHAVELGFVHPTHQGKLQFHMPLPPDLATWWARLKETS